MEQSSKKLSHLEVFHKVSTVMVDEGLSISNAIRFLIKRGDFPDKFNSLRTSYYKVKRANESKSKEAEESVGFTSSKLREFNPSKRLDTEYLEDEVLLEEPSWSEIFSNFFRRIFRCRGKH